LQGNTLAGQTADQNVVAAGADDGSGLHRHTMKKNVDRKKKSDQIGDELLLLQHSM